MSFAAFTGGTNGVFGTSSFACIYKFTSVNYGWILCLADNADLPLKMIAVNSNKAYIFSPTMTKTTIDV